MVDSEDIIETDEYGEEDEEPNAGPQAQFIDDVLAARDYVLSSMLSRLSFPKPPNRPVPSSTPRSTRCCARLRRSRSRTRRSRSARVTSLRRSGLSFQAGVFY
jgi:hypothetical protein